jgi:hypothetical protein
MRGCIEKWEAEGDDFFVKVLWKFDGLEELDLLVGETTVLVSGGALEEAGVGHDCWLARSWFVGKMMKGQTKPNDA